MAKKYAIRQREGHALQNTVLGVYGGKGGEHKGLRTRGGTWEDTQTGASKWEAGGSECESGSMIGPFKAQSRIAVLWFAQWRLRVCRARTLHPRQTPPLTPYHHRSHHDLANPPRRIQSQSPAHPTRSSRQPIPTNHTPHPSLTPLPIQNGVLGRTPK